MSARRFISASHNAQLNQLDMSFFITQANLIGSSIGLWTAYYLERYYRHRREVRKFPSPFLLYARHLLSDRPQIARLYRPVALDADELSLTESESEDELGGTMLLPTHHDRRSNPRTPTSGASSTPGKNANNRIRLGDVWDEREELFGIGDRDSDGGNDIEETRRGNTSRPPRPSQGSGTTTPQQTTGPKIIVTSS